MLVLVRGSRAYKAILSRAFPSHFMSRTFEDRYGRYEWGTYIFDVQTMKEQEIRNLLELLKSHLYIDDDLTETFALDFHTALDASGRYPRTQIGELVYQAKPYNRRASETHRQNAFELADKFLLFIEKHPSYLRAEVVMSVPPSRMGKTFDLPLEIVKQITLRFSMMDGSNHITKNRTTRPMKDCETLQEKAENLRGAFTVNDGADINGRRVLVIDDIYQTGSTLNEVKNVLFEAGAKEVIALVATKTGRDLA